LCGEALSIDYSMLTQLQMLGNKSHVSLFPCFLGRRARLSIYFIGLLDVRYEVGCAAWRVEAMMAKGLSMPVQRKC
jgi:hypothetical protein